jgi:hypothetical protein
MQRPTDKTVTPPDNKIIAFIPSINAVAVEDNAILARVEATLKPILIASLQDTKHLASQFYA